MKYRSLICILLAVFSLAFSQQASAQNVSLNIENGKISDVLKEIQKQTSFKFAYNNSVIDVNVPVSIKVENEDLKAVLDKVLRSNGINYKIVDRQILLSPAKSVKMKIRGKVTEEGTGQPLPGTVVSVKGGSEFSVADEDGSYEIETEQGALLDFSMLGMLSKEVSVGKQSVVNVVLAPDVVALDDVVVTGYQTISRERATGSFDNIGKELLDKPATSLEQSLVGNVAGLQIVNKGYFERDEEIVIRGVTTLGANANPLIIVDGFAIEGELSSINPNDIASITVLKDAAAASIWGARSANGVIVVTTKSAQKGKVNVELNAFVKFSEYMDPDYANPLASSAETVEYEKLGFNTGFFNAGQPLADNYSSSIYYNYGRFYSQASIYMNEARLGYMSQSELDAALSKLASQDNRDQIRKYLLSRPVTQQYNLTVSGGTDRMSHVASLMYDDNITAFKGNDNQRYTLNYRTNVNLFRWLDLSVSSMFQYNSSRTDGVTLEEIQSMSPYDMLIGENGEYLNVQKSMYLPIIDRYITQKGVQFPYSDWSYNPVQEMRERDITNKSIYGRFQAGLNFKILKGLTFDSKFQYEIMEDKSKSLYGEDSYQVRFNVNYNSQWDGNPATPVKQNYANGMAIQEGSSSLSSWNFRNQLNFDRTFASRHQVSAIAGMELSSRVLETKTGSMIYGYDDELLSVTPPINGVSSSTNPMYTMFGSASYSGPSYPVDMRAYNIDRYFSAYLNASYTYDKKYTVSGSVRTDASNLISSDPSIRYSPFWSVGASWNIGEEKFIKNISWIDRLLVRATYGFNGNVDKSTSVDPLISIWGQNYTSGTGYGVISNYGNPFLSWERTGAFDMGVDFSFLGGKIFGKIDYYDKEGRDLISTVAIPNVYGSDTQSINAVSMYNRGFEVVLGSSLSRRDFNWTGNLSFSYNKNMITSLFKDPATLAYRVYGPGSGWEYAEGYNANTLWGFIYGGVREIAGVRQPVIVDKNGENPRAMTTSNTSFDSSDYLVDMGTSVPPVILGFNSSFSWKNLRLSFIITGYFGHKFKRMGFNYPTMSRGVGDVNKYYYEIVNCDPDEFIPLPDFESGERYASQLSGYSDMMDYLYLNAANIRFQELNLTYTLPSKAVRKIGIDGLQIYGQMNDIGVVTFNGYGEDPFYPMGTVKPGISWTFGLKLKF